MRKPRYIFKHLNQIGASKTDEREVGYPEGTEGGVPSGEKVPSGNEKTSNNTTDDNDDLRHCSSFCDFCDFFD